jgi:hypothetical protein
MLELQFFSHLLLYNKKIIFKNDEIVSISKKNADLMWKKQEKCRKIK